MTSTLAADLSTLGPLHGTVWGNTHTQLVAYGPESGDTTTENTLAPSSIVEWAGEHRSALINALHSHGAVLVRGAVPTPEVLSDVAEAVGGTLLEYNERTTPRSTVSGNVYTSTEYPANQTIPQHNELAYSANSPRWLFFACAIPASGGGATPLADSGAVLRRLPAELVSRFRDLGVLYTRCYMAGMGLTWQEAFQTEDRAKVEEYCHTNGMEFEWFGEDELRTRSRRPAVVTDPDSGQEVWFNQAHLFHLSNLPTNVAAALSAMYEERDYPRHSFYGDGSPLAEDDLALIRAAYDDTVYATPWQTGDLLIVNNLRVSHGRQPYEGARKIMVAMAGTLDVGPAPVLATTGV